MVRRQFRAQLLAASTDEIVRPVLSPRPRMVYTPRMQIVLISIVVILSFIITYAAFWLGVRIFGVRVTSNQLLLAVLAVFLVSGGLSICVSLFGASDRLGALVALLLSGYIWYLFIHKFTSVKTAKAIGSFALGSFISWLSILVLSFTLLTVVQSYRIDGQPMSPAYADGTRVLVFKRGQHWNKGDVVIHEFMRKDRDPSAPQRGKTVGRILGIPGERITPDRTYFLATGFSYESASYSLKEGEYYIAGDNQDASFGYIVKSENIIGKVGPRL